MPKRIGFRVNIENGLRTHMSDDGGRFLASELCRHLKEMRDRLEKLDGTALDEFFTIYCFSEDQSRGLEPWEFGFDKMREDLVSLAKQIIADIDGVENEIYKPRGEEIAEWSSLANTRRWAKELLEKYDVEKS